MKLKLDKFGRVVLPKLFRARYGLRPGAELEIIERPEEFVLRPIRNSAVLVEMDGIWVHQGVLGDGLDFAKALRAEREERMQRVHGSN